MKNRLSYVIALLLFCTAGMLGINAQLRGSDTAITRSVFSIDPMSHEDPKDSIATENEIPGIGMTQENGTINPSVVKESHLGPGKKSATPEPFSPETQDDLYKKGNDVINTYILDVLEQPYNANTVTKSLKELANTPEEWKSEAYKAYYTDYLPLLKNYGSYNNEMKRIVERYVEIFNGVVQRAPTDKGNRFNDKYVSPFKSYGYLKNSKDQGESLIVFRYFNIYKDLKNDNNKASICYLDDRIGEIIDLLDGYLNYLKGLNNYKDNTAEYTLNGLNDVYSKLGGNPSALNVKIYSRDIVIPENNSDSSLNNISNSNVNSTTDVSSNTVMRTGKDQEQQQPVNYDTEFNYYISRILNNYEDYLNETDSLHNLKDAKKKDNKRIKEQEEVINHVIDNLNRSFVDLSEYIYDYYKVHDNRLVYEDDNETAFVTLEKKSGFAKRKVKDLYYKTRDIESIIKESKNVVSSVAKQENQDRLNELVEGRLKSLQEFYDIVYPPDSEPTEWYEQVMLK